MAWRPHRYLIEGQLNNTEPRKVTGWMRFLGLPERVTFDLDGDFHRDIRGASIQLSGDAAQATDLNQAREYIQRFSLHQTGKVGDITAGLPPQDYSSYPYVEWYSNENGRVVLELRHEQVKVIGTPIPYIESDPISREDQGENLADFLKRIQDELGPLRDEDGPGEDG